MKTPKTLQIPIALWMPKMAGLLLLGQGLSASVLYVEDNVAPSLLALDASSGKMLARIALPASPHGLALCPAQGRLYVAGGDAGTLSVIETTTNKLSRTVKVGAAAWGLAMSPDCTKVYTAGAGSGTLNVVDTASFATQEIAVGQYPLGVALDPEGRWLLGLNFGNPGSLSLLNPRTLTPERSFQAGRGPHSVTVSPDGKWLVVSSLESREVVLLDTTRFSLKARHRSGATPEGVAFRNPNEVWVSYLDSDYVDVLHVPSLQPQRSGKRIPTGKGPFGIAFSRDGRWAYVSNMREGSVVKIDAQSRQVVARFMVGGEPHRLLLWK